MQQHTTILWLASWYPTRLDPYPGDFIQRHARALALYHPVHVLHIAKDEIAQITESAKTETCSAAGVTETIHYYHPAKTGFRFLDKLISTRAFLKAGKKLIAQIVKEQPVGLIHLHVAMRHGLLARWAKKKFGIPFVITEHWTGYNQDEYPANLRPANWFWLATKKIFRDADFFYPEVNKVGEIVNHTICQIPFQPVANAVDIKLFNYDPELSNGNRMFNFIHVSTLSYQKNIEGILRVIEKLVDFSDRYSFTLVGPASKEIISKVASSASLNKLVRLTGAVTYEQVAHEVKSSNCLLMFSRYENQPCVILEALCAGLPVISTRVGGISEVINPSNGLLIASENEAELEQAIHTMYTSYKSYDRNAISEQSKALYSYETIGAQMIDYYRINKPGLPEVCQ